MNPILVYILLSLLGSAFFSAAEIAFVSSNKLLFELEKRKKKLTPSILNVFYKKPNQFVFSMLIGNNIALVIYGLLMARLLTPFLNQLISNDWVVLSLQSLIAAFFILIAGEFVPKAIARFNPNFFLSFFSIPLYLAYILLYPVSQIISGISWVVLRLFRVRLTSGLYQKSLGREDLDYFIQKTIEESPEEMELDKEVRFFQNAMDFSSVKVRDCMIPRTEIEAIDIQTSVEELKSRFIETGLSKIIVYKEDIDNIVGYIHSSEMFTQPEDWTQSVVVPPFVPENMAANILMKNMLSEKKSIAVVVDEFGGTSGVITLEDLVEEIFGEIEDEHDTRLHVAKQVKENEYILSGRMEIDQVNEQFHLSIPESDEYLTIAGYILNHHQKFPKLHETVVIDPYVFKVIKVTRTKIELVKLMMNKK